jgi:hypothetical protein
MKFSLSMQRCVLASILAAAIFGSLTSAQEQDNIAFATVNIVPLEPIERPDSTDDSQDGGEEDRKEKKEKEDNNADNEGEEEEIREAKRAPVVISGDNTYSVWWTNTTGNDEVMLRVSTDGGATFSDKINLSNTTDANSTRAEIDADGDNIIVSWWETNQTSDTPVARISTDSGQTFGPTLMLATNGTIGEEAEEEPEEGE